MNRLRDNACWWLADRILRLASREYQDALAAIFTEAFGSDDWRTE